MSRISLVVALTFILLFSVSATAENDAYQQCLVIGQESDPARGRQFFKEAMEAWRLGKNTMAVELYEQAIIADHSVLKHEDHGLAMKLLEKYRDMAEPQTVAALCRRGFFENILIGNLETSIKYYQDAARSSTVASEIQLASDEAERLKGQLSYIQNWQKNIKQQNRIKRASDLNAYLQRSALDNLQSQAEDNSYEIAELKERLVFLYKQEKEISTEMYSSVRSAGRYRRNYYYPGAYQGQAVDPGDTGYAGGNWGSDGSPATEQVANPYAGQPNTGVARKVALNRFYTYRNRAKRQQDQLDQVRAEISGLNRRIAEIEKANLKLREKIDPNPIKSGNN